MKRVYRGFQIGMVQVTWWWHPMYWELLWTPRHLVAGPLDIWRPWPGLR